MTGRKTNLGGACAATGTFLFGVPVLLKSMDWITLDPFWNGCIKFSMALGLLMTMAGVFLSAYFSPDKSEVVAMLNKNNLDTTALTPAEAKDTKPSPSE